MRETLVAIACFILSSCASQHLVTNGNIVGENYITANGLLTLSAPPGWQWSTDLSRSDVEKLASKLKRPREVVLLLNSTDLESFMLIEAYKLTWGGQPITPAVLTSTIPPERVRSICYYSMRGKPNSKFASYEYECFVHEMNSECHPDTPCLESRRQRISIRQNDQFVFDRTYMIGIPSQRTQSQEDRGWRMSFTLFTPEKIAEENKIAFDSVIGSIRLAD